MNGKQKIAVVLLAMGLIVSVLVGCEASDEFAPKQRTQIEKYLASKGVEFSLVGDSVFVYVAGNKLADAGMLPAEPQTIAKGDSLVFNFEAYTFASTPANKPYYTNKKWLMDKFYPTFDSSYWDFSPRRIKVGTGAILKGLEEALMGRMEGDSVAVFLTSNNGYGDHALGYVDKNTALMWVLNVEQIKKN